MALYNWRILAAFSPSLCIFYDDGPPHRLNIYFWTSMFWPNDKKFGSFSTAVRKLG